MLTAQEFAGLCNEFDGLNRHSSWTDWAIWL